MIRRTQAMMHGLPYKELNALEISGNAWADFGFKSYRSVSYPAYDVCEATLQEQYDVIIAEQVFEHLLWPYRAVRNVHSMLKGGGHFLVTTPFLVKVHGHPIDCSRWTPLGLKYLLAEGGFPLGAISTESWGSRRCAISMFRRWTPYISWLHSLRNEDDFPVHVWAMARKAVEGP